MTFKKADGSFKTFWCIDDGASTYTPNQPNLDLLVRRYDAVYYGDFCPVCDDWGNGRRWIRVIESSESPSQSILQGHHVSSRSSIDSVAVQQ